MVCRLNPKDCACGICAGGQQAPEGYFGGTYCQCVCHTLKGTQLDEHLAKRRKEKQVAAEQIVEELQKRSPDKQETPRTDAAWIQTDPNGELDVRVRLDVLCRQLERELAESVNDSKAILLENAKLNEALSATLPRLEAAERLLGQIRKANIIFPSMCANNMEAMNLLEAIDVFLKQTSYVGEKK